MNILLILELSSRYLKDNECLRILLLNKYIRNNIRMYPSYQ